MTPSADRQAIGASSVVVAASDQVSSDLAGEKVILSVKSGRYYGLKGVGARIWELLAEPRRVEDIAHVLTGEYEVDEARCLQDLLDLLAELESKGLVEVRRASAH